MPDDDPHTDEHDDEYGDQRADEYDGPWKAALRHYFEPFPALLFPAIHARIDWRAEPVFLDTELQQLASEAQVPRGMVDKLVQVEPLRPGPPLSVLVHVEIQAQRDASFEQRMFVYHYRLFDRTRRPALSLAVLADDQPTWRPTGYAHELWGCELALRFPTVKLLDLVRSDPGWNALAADPNPFALFVIAHLKTQATRRAYDERELWTLWLWQRLLLRGYSERDIFELYRFFSWLLWVPPAIRQRIDQAVARECEERGMPYMTSWERKGWEQGLQEGKQQGLQEGKQQGLRRAILRALQFRFGAVPAELRGALEAVDDLDQLDDLLQQAIVDESLATFAARLPPP